MRPLGPGGYQSSCGPGCGCDNDNTQDPENSGSISLPENITYEEQLLWEIFGNRHEQEEGENE